jgi:PhoPQ-activated pathogenicity-related protein
MMTVALLWSFGLLEQASQELSSFVVKTDPSYSWKRKTVLGQGALDLVSQTWQGAPWKHDVLIVNPSGPKLKGSAIIEVTGWEPNQRDIAYAQTLADSSGLSVALLFHVPNQPLFGMEEDDLIAHTFEKFFETGDPSWPLLFPMVKSVKAAMDALGESEGVDKFVITGGSKRGWTAWLVGALRDPRVVGIAPVVFDNLGFVAQLQRQKAYWDGYSPMIADYTERGLQDLLESERGKELVRLMDPLQYASSITVPTLVLTGTNDPYWTIDSTQVYWSKLAMPKWSLAVPNAGHTMGDKGWWAPSLGKFARACADGTRLPSVSSQMTVEEGTWRVGIDTSPGPTSYTVWSATSPDMHFDKAVWKEVETKELATTEGNRGIWVSGDQAKTHNTAVLVELKFSTSNGDVRLTTPVYLARKR